MNFLLHGISIRAYMDLEFFFFFFFFLATSKKKSRNTDLEHSKFQNHKNAIFLINKLWNMLIDEDVILPKKVTKAVYNLYSIPALILFTCSH